MLLRNPSWRDILTLCTPGVKMLSYLDLSSYPKPLFFVFVLASPSTFPEEDMRIYTRSLQYSGRDSSYMSVLVIILLSFFFSLSLCHFRPLHSLSRPWKHTHVLFFVLYEWCSFRSFFHCMNKGRNKEGRLIIEVGNKGKKRKNGERRKEEKK